MNLFDTSEMPAAESAPVPKAPKRSRSRTIVPAVAAGALLLGGTGAVFADAHKQVDIDMDGQVVSHNTFAGSVAGLLEEAGIELSEHDDVVPGPNEALHEGGVVVVRTGDQITVTVGGNEKKVWTMALTATEALADLSASGRDTAMMTSRSGGRTSLGLPLAAGAVAIKVDGKTKNVTLDAAAWLTQVLLRAEVKLGGNDTVEVSTKSGAAVVTVTRRDTERKKTTKTVEHQTEKRESDDLYEGESKIVRKGKNGKRTIVTVTELVNGAVDSSKRVSNKVTTKPVTEIIEIGTKKRPEPEPSSSNRGLAPSSGVWARLAQCESGGDPNVVSSNGLYHGLYQFSVATWQAMGGSGLPFYAPASEQTMRAKKLQATSGWGQWPHCSSALGLR